MVSDSIFTSLMMQTDVNPGWQAKENKNAGISIFVTTCGLKRDGHVLLDVLYQVAFKNS